MSAPGDSSVQPRAAGPGGLVRFADEESLEVTIDRPSGCYACIRVAGYLSTITVALLVGLLDQQLAQGRRWILVEGDQLQRVEAAAVAELRASHRRLLDAGGALLVRGLRAEMLDRGNAPPEGPLRRRGGVVSLVL